MCLSNSFNEDVLQDYVNKVNYRSRIAADTIKIYLYGREETKNSKQEFGAVEYAEVLLEYAIFFLHFTDRCVFGEGIVQGYMDEKQRDSLMTELEERCINSSIDYGFFGLAEFAKEEIKEKSFVNFNTRQEEYSKYKKYLPDEKDEGLKGTLFWEFSKNISKLVGRDHDPFLHNLCVKILVDAIADLDTKSFVKNVKHK